MHVKQVSGDTCPGCRTTRHKLWGHKNSFGLFRCSTCGVIFTSDHANAAEISALYDHYYDCARFDLPPVVAMSLDRLVFSMESHRRTGRWLDIGFGEGGLLTIAQRRSWSCHGTEISPAALEYGARQGWQVTSDPLADDRFPAQGFDVISMVEILEHLPAPDELLQTAAYLLRPGGILYLTTPNAQSLNRRIIGAQWSIFSPPEHLVIWTPKGVCQALARHGLTPLRVRTEGLNPSEILRRFRRNDKGSAPSRNTTGVKLNETFSRSPLRRGIKSAINHCLSMLRVGDSLKVWAQRAIDQ